jgi:hypothetical protein
MRCATCGTENAQDSKFCGGCGARMATRPVVAPTQKIADDAAYPASHPQHAAAPPYGHVSGPASLPPQSHGGNSPANAAYPAAPRSIPPQNAGFGPASIPPHNAGVGPTSIPPQNAGFGSIPPQNVGVGPTSIPPQNAGFGSIPPPSAPPRDLGLLATTPSPSMQRPSVPELSTSMAPRQGRRWGLIVAVGILDLGLIGAGIYMLMEGLATPTTSTSTGAPASSSSPTPAATK